MRFHHLDLDGACVIDLERHGDKRGFFARAFCQHEFAEQGLATEMVQTNVSYNKREGTLRGMHYQTAPKQENKLVRCTRGSIYDVIVDVRPDSNTFKRWFSIELTAENRRMLYVPEGFAHGFITLEHDCEVIYQVSESYAPAYEAGLRYNDPAVSINWPIEVNVISERDQRWPDFHR
jgi:dTDP-4-dehydrorhamnose 3,5-epimerase